MDINKERADRLSILVTNQNAEIRRLKRKISELEALIAPKPLETSPVEIPLDDFEVVEEPRKKPKKKIEVEVPADAV